METTSGKVDTSKKTTRKDVTGWYVDYDNEFRGGK